MSTYVTLVELECWVCGVPFAITDALKRALTRDEKRLYCPRGCHLAFGESEESKLRKQLIAKDATLDQVRAEREHQRERVEGEKRSHAATKGALTKTKKRIGNGVCPCCNRTFKQLARHMKTKHPEYVEA